MGTGIAVDTSLSYCHYALNDTSLVSSGFLDFCTARDIALINASPISMGPLTANPHTRALTRIRTRTLSLSLTRTLTLTLTLTRTLSLSLSLSLSRTLSLSLSLTLAPPQPQP